MRMYRFAVGGEAESKEQREKVRVLVRKQLGRETSLAVFACDPEQGGDDVRRLLRPH